MIQDMKLTSLKLGGTPLEYVDTYKYLGITIVLNPGCKSKKLLSGDK